MSIFLIKMIACFTMVLDHIKYAIPETRGWLTIYFGRIAFPLYAFLAVEGYIHTSNLKKYLKRLFIFALISQIPFMLFRTLVGQWQMLNIIFTLILGIFAIIVLDNLGEKYYLSIPIIVIIIFMGKYLRVDYGWYGVSTVLLFYLCRDKKIFRILAFLLLNLIYYYTRIFINYSIENIILYISVNIPVIILLFYNGKLGRKTRYFYYWFYPVHMVALYIVRYLR